MPENWAQQQSVEEAGLSFIFPTKDKFKQLQMLTELRPREVVPLSIVGLFRRLYKSEVLKIWEDEIFVTRKSLDRKGELVAAEMMAARRRALEEDNEKALGSL